MISAVGAKPAPLVVVVVAEDETLIRMMAVDALTEAGFVVVEAGHSADALAILTARPNGIHALFTDIHMPGSMNGLALAHHVHDHWPWIALIVTSGQAQPLAAEMPEGSRFLSKPYDPVHVVKHVRELVAGG
jgi:two-component system, response regulator PdtaR